MAVLSAFYDYHAQTGLGPVLSPVPPPSRGGRRLNAHHNQLEPFRQHRRAAYRQKQPDLPPRPVPDEVLDDLFARLECNRDRALFHMFLASGARAAEMLGTTVSDARPRRADLRADQGPRRGQAGMPVLTGGVLLAGALPGRAGRGAWLPARAGRAAVFGFGPRTGLRYAQAARDITEGAEDDGQARQPTAPRGSCNSRGLDRSPRS